MAEGINAQTLTATLADWVAGELADRVGDDAFTCIPGVSPKATRAAFKTNFAAALKRDLPISQSDLDRRGVEAVSSEWAAKPFLVWDEVQGAFTPNITRAYYYEVDYQTHARDVMTSDTRFFPMPLQRSGANFRCVPLFAVYLFAALPQVFGYDGANGYVISSDSAARVVAALHAVFDSLENSEPLRGYALGEYFAKVDVLGGGESGNQVLVSLPERFEPPTNYGAHAWIAHSGFKLFMGDYDTDPWKNDGVYFSPDYIAALDDAKFYPADVVQPYIRAGDAARAARRKMEMMHYLNIASLFYGMYGFTISVNGFLDEGVAFFTKAGSTSIDLLKMFNAFTGLPFSFAKFVQASGITLPGYQPPIANNPGPVPGAPTTPIEQPSNPWTPPRPAPPIEPSPVNPTPTPGDETPGTGENPGGQQPGDVSTPSVDWSSLAMLALALLLNS